MQTFTGETLSWELKDGCIELALHREPANEIGSKTLEALEQSIAAHETIQKEAHALIVHSQVKAGFSAGADLRDLYHNAKAMGFENAAPQVRDFLNRIHRVMNALDVSPLVTIAAVHGVCFGGGFELALV